METNNIDKFERITITVPLKVVIMLDIERKKNNLTRSAYIRQILEGNFASNKDDGTSQMLEINTKLEEIKQLLLNTK